MHFTQSHNFLEGLRVQFEEFLTYYKILISAFVYPLPCGSITQLLMRNGETAKIGAAKNVKP